MNLCVIEVVYTQYSVNRTGIEKKKLHLVTLLTLLFPFHQKKYRVLQLKIVRSKMTVELKTCNFNHMLVKLKDWEVVDFFQFLDICLQFFKKSTSSQTHCRVKSKCTYQNTVSGVWVTFSNRQTICRLDPAFMYFSSGPTIMALASESLKTYFTQCGNFRVLLSFRFYVKSMLRM